MEPAFSSTRQAAAFAFLLLVLLLLPALLGKTALPPREQLYSAVPWRFGPYPYLHQAIFDQKDDIDIAFVGASTILWGIDTPYVENALTKELGRKASVTTVAWNWAGFDALYFIAQDLLQNRKVHTIVFSDVTRDDERPHEAAPYWFRFGDNAEAIRGIPFRDTAQYYFAAILGMPRNLLSLIRPNSSDYLFSPSRLKIPGVESDAENPATALGSLAIKIGFDFRQSVDFVPASNASPSDALIYSSAAADKFRFSKDPIPPLQLHFARKFAALARMHGARLILITLPRTDNPSSPFIQNREFWPEMMGSDVTMLGIPPAKLFPGMAPDAIDKLFFNKDHLNKNGQEYFTRLVTPALLKAYETQAND